MMGVKRILAGAGATVMIAGSVMFGLALPAHAGGATITVTPDKVHKGGDKVTVVASGYAPGAAVAIGICPSNITPKGPGDCAPSKSGGSVLTAANSSGTATTTITIVEGKLGSSNNAAARCDATHPCSIGSVDIPKKVGFANYKIRYASTGSSAAVVKTTTTKTTTAAATTSPKSLAKTGPRQTLFMALIGFALLQVGLVFAVRASRAAPRRVGLIVGR